MSVFVFLFVFMCDACLRFTRLAKMQQGGVCGCVFTTAVVAHANWLVE